MRACWSICFFYYSWGIEQGQVVHWGASGGIVAVLCSRLITGLDSQVWDLLPAYLVWEKGKEGRGPLGGNPIVQFGCAGGRVKERRGSFPQESTGMEHL